MRSCLKFSYHAEQSNIFKSCAYVMLAFVLSGCAMGRMFMAGYTPPQTIADLLNEQYALAGELPPELQDTDGKGARQISLNSVRGSAQDQKQGQVEVDENLMLMSQYQQVKSFRPSFSYKGIEDYAAQLSMALVKNSVGINRHLRIGVSSFVELDETLQTTSILGNQLAEHFIGEIQSYGLSVIDHKLMPALQVNTRGDIAFSRDVTQLANNNIMDHVLSGTIIRKANGAFVNARIISLLDNRVIASAHILIPDFVVDSVHPQYVSM
ncbi:FlgO family outer membrane protein [Agaribacter flavus]|uniref:FlgO family outer membrane protein n=1 Tax=Agaribacter flavus TaxID=1902781 RepID=A0ABV7FNN7_9ALTE